MFDSRLLGSWSELVDRLDQADYPHRWSAQPALTGLSSIAQLKDWTAPGQPQRADEVLGGLVHLAALAGAADAEATVVLMHLLRPGAYRIAEKLHHLAPDAFALVLGELAIQIRRFPIERRTHAHAANLLLDTQMVVWRELRPYRTDLAHRQAELLIDPIDDARVSDSDNGEPGLLDHSNRGPEDDDLDLVDMLLWARRTGAVDAEDLAVLVELEYACETPGVSPQQHVASAHGWTVRTVQRRRDRALVALRACSSDYLAAA
ncbi:MAG: hypothetical protein ACRDQ1_18220 [Sciscionella sp.]